ncbi:MAG: glycolate oxidase subunit GlcF [bacterium]|jgi:glycolate oxidase iron-sulfur subunit
MQTSLAAFIRDTAEGKEAESILRACVHCGFCTATCPTYQLVGDELDGPRGRIYLIKQVLEGTPATTTTRDHLDRCLTCRACETTCPSGVRYGRLADIGRQVVEAQVPRTGGDRLLRQALRTVLPRPALFGPMLSAARALKPLLPAALANKVPPRRAAGTRPAPRHARRMLVLEGCVQPAIAPGINAAAARVLDRLGVSLVAAPAAGCCGAVTHHLNAHDAALDQMRRNVDAWWPAIEGGAEAIVITASGCGAMVKEYAALLAHDPDYAARAARVTGLSRDLSEVVAAELARPGAALPPRPAPGRRVAFHAPCTLQHALRLRGKVEPMLAALGLEPTEVPDAHLCCGSAGTFSILQPDLSRRLLEQKVAALKSDAPMSILTANIGCLGHLQAGFDLPVEHWIEAVDRLWPDGHEPDEPGHPAQ